MTRNAPLEDNTPIQSGLMAASPDGKGFEATFENFTVKHLPDQRISEWLKITNKTIITNY
jgi:regulation of enolase protein 1 (concanavalin A-like superfamily)